MSKTRFLRFSGFARALHWLIAIPYIVLLASGAILVLLRIGWINGFPTNLIANLHRWVGIGFAAIILELIIAALITGRWRAIGRDVREWLLPRPRDVLWLLCVPLNSCFPRWVSLPPAGRFNAGQKLHGLFILFAIIGFIVTGLLMVFVHGWLKVWLIHTWLFFGAAAFLCLHLFLALINPTTRRALGGIFTGKVSHEYIRDHHVLELDGPPVHAHPHAAVSILAVLLVLLPIAAALYLWWNGPGRNLVYASMAPSQKNAFISPGQLTRVHASKIESNACVKCHINLGPPARNGCLDCHTQIRQMLDQKTGYHGTLTGNCSTCHKEHHGASADLRNFDTRAFNHQLARFKLRGTHQTLACDQCHVAHSDSPGVRRFIGLTFATCGDCHSNPHVDMPSADCARCHTEQGWKGRDLLFLHNRDTTFKLDAIHVGLSCGACHTASESTHRFGGLATTCEQCHFQISQAMAGRVGASVVNPDPHNGRLGCIQCHSPDVPKPTPAQFAGQCERCHGFQYRTLFFNWQKTLDEQEQAARLRLRRPSDIDPQALQNSEHLIDQAHVAGMHNMQGATEIFKTIGKVKQ